MRPLTIIAQDVYWHSLEHQNSPNTLPPFLKSEAFVYHGERKLPADTTDTCFYTLPTDFFSEAVAIRIGSSNQYQLYEVNAFGSLPLTGKKGPLTFADPITGDKKIRDGEAYPIKGLYSAAQALEVWARSRIEPKINRQEVVRTAKRTPFHYSPWLKPQGARPL